MTKEHIEKVPCMKCQKFVNLNKAFGKIFGAVTVGYHIGICQNPLSDHYWHVLFNAHVGCDEIKIKKEARSDG